MSHYAKVENGIVSKVIVAEAEFFDTFVDESSKKSATVVSHLLPILDAWHD